MSSLLQRVFGSLWPWLSANIVNLLPVDSDNENKSLKDENAFLKENLAKQTQEQSEMYHYFNGKLDQHVVLIASLEKELALANTEHEQLIHDHEAVMETVQSQFQAELTRASEEIDNLKLELRQLHVFSQQKLQIETQMEELEATLVRTTKQFEEEKLELERKSIFEKDRVKKEMLLRMKETKEELLQRTDDQLNTTTKRTMMENDHFMEELSYQSKETEKLLTRYHVLEDEVKLLRVKTKMLEENEAVMAKKNYYYQKILQKLQKKEEKAALDTLVKDEEALLLLQQAASGGGGAGLEERRSSSEENIRVLKAHVDELEAALKNANDWIHMFQQEKQYMVAQQDEVIQFLCRAIQDAAVEVARGNGNTFGGASDLPQIAKLAKETTKMDDFAALVPPLVVLDELSPDENRFVLQFLLEKMKIYQQRIALLFQNTRHSHSSLGAAAVFGSPTASGVKHRDLISKQLGVELPPIAQVPSSGSSAGSGSPMSPLKQNRRMFAHVTSSIAAAIGGEPGTNQNNSNEPNRRSPLAGIAGYHSLQPPSNSLLAMATNQFNFLSTAAVQAGKSPMKSQLSSQASPSSSSMKNNSHTRAMPSGSPAKTGGVRKVQPPGNASIFAKKAHGHAAMTASTESVVLDGSSLLQSRDMLTAWSNSSIQTLADPDRASLEQE